MNIFLSWIPRKILGLGSWDLLRSRKSPEGSILFIRRIMEISYKALDLLPVLTIKSEACSY